MLLNKKLILEESLNSGNNMTFIEFIRYNNINLDTLYIDDFFHTLQHDKPIYMTDKMIEYFGYGGSIKVQKELVNRLLTLHFSGYINQMYFKYNNDEYNNLKHEIVDENKSLDPLYPTILSTHGKGKTIHLLIMPSLFKELLMVCTTTKGKKVREFYVRIVDIMFIYIKYQDELKFIIIEQKLNLVTLKLAENNDKYLIKVEELKESNQDMTNIIKDRLLTKYVGPDDINRIVIFKINKIEEKKGEENKIEEKKGEEKKNIDEYYVARIQKKSVNAKLINLTQTYPNNIIAIIFNEPNPNAIITWKTIFTKFIYIKKSTSRNCFMLDNKSEALFIEDLIKLENEERTNPKCV